MSAAVAIKRCDKFVESRRRCWVKNDEHWGQTSGTGFARERKFFGKAALPAGRDRNAKFEFAGELVLAIVAINLTAFAGCSLRSFRRLTGEFFEPAASPPRQLAN